MRLFFNISLLFVFLWACMVNAVIALQLLEGGWLSFECILFGIGFMWFLLGLRDIAKKVMK